MPETQAQTFKLSVALLTMTRRLFHLSVRLNHTQRTPDLDGEMEEFDTIEIYSCFKCVTACCLQSSESVLEVVLRGTERSE